jgi:type II secretory pathway component PulF
MMRRLNLTLFFQGVSVLLRAGLDLPRAVERSAAIVPNRLMGRHLVRPLSPIESGATVTEAFSTVRWLPRTVREMIAIGEQSGTLAKALARTSKSLRTEGMHPLYVIVTLVEAVFILAIGSMVFRMI